MIERKEPVDLSHLLLAAGEAGAQAALDGALMAAMRVAITSSAA